MGPATQAGLGLGSILPVSGPVCCRAACPVPGLLQDPGALCLLFELGKGLRSRCANDIVDFGDLVQFVYPREEGLQAGGDRGRR